MKEERRRRRYSQVAAVSFDALGRTETLAVVGVAHAGVAVTLTG